MMSAIQVRLPSSLHEAVRELAKSENVSMNQLIILAVAEKVASLLTETYIQERAERANRASFEAALAQVPDVEPASDDAL